MSNHYQIVANMPYVSPAMRVAAPEICEQLDNLRKERKTARERRWYLNTAGKEEEAAAVQQRVTEIDAGVATLHAQAKEQLLAGVAKDITAGAASLRCAANTSVALADSLAEENKRHSDAVATIVHLQKSVGSKFSDTVNTMEAAAGSLTDGGEEQAPEPGAAVAGAGSSTDMACPNCSKICKGDKGVHARLRNCKAQIDAEQAPGAEAAPADQEQAPEPGAAVAGAGSSTDMACPICAKICKGVKGLASHKRNCKAPDAEAPDAEAPANVNPTSADKEHARVGDIDSKAPCPNCPKIFRNERALRTHKRHCKGPSDDKPAPATPADGNHFADKVCPAACSKVCRGTHGLVSHRRTCRGQTDAVETTGPVVAGAAGDVDAEGAPAESKRAGEARLKSRQALLKPVLLKRSML